MDSVSLLAGLIIGMAAGALLAWLALHFRTAGDRQLSQQFGSLASEALNRNNESFLRLANQTLEKHLADAKGDLETRKQRVEGLVKPLAESLREMERERQTAYGGLKQLVEAMSESQQTLVGETRHLTQALRNPQVRGRWGEMTLRRVAELAGMVENCDFVEQPTLTEESGHLRPDMVVNLPSRRRIAVDAKTPLNAYLEAIEADNDEARSSALKQHSRQVRDRAKELANKSYWASLDYSPEFVVLFLPGDVFLGAALQEDPEILERAMREREVIATPSTFIALLHVVAYGWRQEQLADNARRISELGREMHDRLATWAGHLVSLRDSLSRTVEAFNRSVGSLEHRVLVSGRQFKSLGIGSDKDVPQVPPIDLALRSPSADDSVPGPAPEPEPTDEPTD